MRHVCRRSCISSRLLPLSSSHLCLCNSLLGGGGASFIPLTAPRGGNIGKINRSPAGAELREGGAGMENMLRAANKRPRANGAPLHVCVHMANA